MSRAGHPVRFHPEAGNRWIACTANDAYFVVDGRAKEVIEFLAISPSEDAAWDTYVRRASSLPQVTRDDFGAIGAQIAQGQAPRQASHMRIRAKTCVLTPEMASRLAARLVFLFPATSLLPAVVSLIIAFALTQAGTPFAPAEAIPRHAGAIATVVLVLVGVFIHELGHAAALRKSGEVPGGVSFGVRYFVYPCFFTDVSSAWLLDRRQRILVNLGGAYLQAMFAALLWATAVASRDVAMAPLLEASRTSAFLCLLQLVPFPGSDGHWIVRDVASVHLNDRTRTGRLLEATGWVALTLLGYQACVAALRFSTMLRTAWSSHTLPEDIVSWRNLCALLLIVAFARVLPTAFAKLHGYAAHPCKHFFTRGFKGD